LLNPRSQTASTRAASTSAYDEALIARQALRTPAFLDYDETRQAWFPITARHRI
jgi:D-alanyl-D-alanine carboxypeptidase